LWRRSLLGWAIDDFLKLAEKVRGEEKLEKALRTRGRELPGLVSSGLLPLLSFLYAQTEGKFTDVRRWVEGTAPRPDNMREEKISYSLCLYLLLSRLSELWREVSKEELPLDPPQCIKRMTNLRPSELSLITQAILTYAEEFKKLCEGALKGEG